MQEIIIWHNPRCRKSREGLQYLRYRDVEPQIFQYLKEKFTAEALAQLIEKNGQPLGDFIRTKEKEFKELGLKGKELSLEEFSRIAVEHPKLLERPIFIRGEKVVLARPAENIDRLL